MPAPLSYDRILAFCVAVLLGLAAASAQAVPDCTIDCVGTSCVCNDTTGAPCEISTPPSPPIPAGATIACSGQDIVLADTLQVTDGVMTLEVDDLTVNASHKMEAVRTQAGIPFGMVITASGTVTVTGRLQANSDWGGGFVRVETTGATSDIVVASNVSKGILAKGTASGASGGRVELVSARDVVVQDPIEVPGATQGSTHGGEILIQAGRDIYIQDQLDAEGYDLGGGLIRLLAKNGTITVQAAGYGTPSVLAQGHGQDGEGGAIDFSANELVLGERLSAKGGAGTGGGQSGGGQITLHALEGGITIGADVDASGGALGGGRDGGGIEVLSEGNIAVGGGVDISSASDANGGDGGDIVLRADGWLTVDPNAIIDARGDSSGSNEGRGAQIELEGCYVDIGASVQISAAGYDGGTIALKARESLVVSATNVVIDAGGAVGGSDGEVELWHRTAGRCATDSLPVGCAGNCQIGTCSNDATVPCLADADCTIGCSTGTCDRTCEGTSNACTNDAQCGVCTNQCVVQPDTGGTTSQFNPAPEDLEENNLTPCS